MGNGKKLIAFCMALWLLCMASGCVGDSTADGVIRYEIDTLPVNIDPQLAENETELLMVRNTFEGLLRTAGDGSLVNGAAESYTVSDDGLTYTFALSGAAVWANETPVTAHDFVFAFRRAADPVTQAPNFNMLASIQNATAVHSGKAAASELGVTAQNDQTLVIRLAAKDPNFLYALTSAVAMPCNQAFFEKSSGKYGLSQKTILSNGSFAVTRWQEKDDVIRLSRNSKYKGAFQAKPASVLLLADQDSANKMARLEGGEIDAARIGISEITAAEQLSLNIASFNDTCWAIVTNPNAEAGKAPVRNALRSAVHRNAYANELPSYFSRADSIIPPSVELLGKNYREAAGQDYPVSYDPDAARQAFSAAIASYPGKKLPATTLLYLDDPDMKEVASIIVQQWQQNLGAYINMEPLSRDKLISAVGTGNFQLALFPLTSEDNTAATLLHQFTTNSPGNMIGYSNKEYDETIDSLPALADADTLLAGTKKAEQLLLSDPGIIPIMFTPSVFVSSKKLTDIHFDTTGGRVDFSLVGKKN